MKLSAQEEYGLRCLLQIAQHPGPDPVQISELATGEGLSPEYVAKLVRVLRQGGLVTSTRGATGGYRLSRPASEITMQQVIEVLDGPLFSEAFCQVHTGQGVSCIHRPTDCSVRTLWRWVGGALQQVLEKITLADLLNGPKSMGVRLFEAGQNTPLAGAEPSL